MRIIDEIKIRLRSGNGGNGKVSFRREKFIENGGPDGGNGGNGGDVIFVARNSINTLFSLRHFRFRCAENGRSGGDSNKTGRSGDDLIIEVPVGTQVFDAAGSILITDLTKDAAQFRLLQGGRGGAGNACFKSSTNQAPVEAIAGMSGEEMSVWLKLKMLSDIGLIGLPNAGKSTFLSRVTHAKPKIADYPFTTLSPNLGIVDLYDEERVVIADIPGLIEGASSGIGLGIKFLKHIERCSVLIHLIDANDLDVFQSFMTIRNELEQYSDLLLRKPFVICLNKIDLLTSDEIGSKMESLRTIQSKIFCTSTHMNIGLDAALSSILEYVVSARTMNIK